MSDELRVSLYIAERPHFAQSETPAVFSWRRHRLPADRAVANATPTSANRLAFSPELMPYDDSRQPARPAVHSGRHEPTHSKHIRPNDAHKDRHAHFDRDVIQRLNADYNLALKELDKNVTPRKHQELAARDEAVDRALKIRRRLHAHYCSSTLDPLLRDFHLQAHSLCRKWVDKPLGDRDTLPQPVHSPWASNAKEQVDLQIALLRILENAELPGQSVIRRSNRTLIRSQSSPAAPLHAEPVPGAETVRRSSRVDSKRRSKENLDGESSTKRVKPLGAIDDVPVRSRISSAAATRARPRPEPALAPSKSEAIVRPLGKSFNSDLSFSTSANTSKASLALSVFSHNDNEESPPGTQSTVEENLTTEKKEKRPKPTHPPLQRHPPAGGGRSFSQDSFPASSGDYIALEESFSRYETELPGDAYHDEAPAPVWRGDEIMSGPNVPLADSERVLVDRLRQTWPRLPPWLYVAPLPIAWEVTRVALHCEVSLEELRMTYDPGWKTYNTLRRALRENFKFRGKTFPERPSDEAWKACFTNLPSGDNKLVVLSATLKYGSSPKSAPAFELELAPVSLDKGYRLARRFGADRFLEVTLPSLFQGPSALRDAQTRSTVLKWLIQEPHFLLGRQWKAYFTKSAGQEKTIKDSIRLEPELIPCFRDKIYMFAEQGHDICDVSPLDRANPCYSTKMTVQDMLKWLLEFEKPEQQAQPHLKLFSRIQLGLSKTYPAVVLERHQIIMRKDDIRSDRGEVMNDGIGRMSRRLARRIQTALGLSDIPSAVQGRIGSAKGMWLLDVEDSDDAEWLETYTSQRKWACDAVDAEHRTLEVRSHAATLHSAALNLQFIPVLEDRALDKPLMRAVLANCLKTGLLEDLKSLKDSMKDTLLFRQWVHTNSMRRVDSLHEGNIRFLGGLPVSKEDRLAMLVDAGFDPMKQKYLKDLAFEIQRNKCAVLKKRMKIKLNRSAYIYMVVDFWGVLEENEVHIGFSSRFSDEFPETLLHDMDVLVARAPAHFPSDIQKVRAVFKPELRCLKDVIIFPRKGDFPLAGKLSGGDYDGDQAWVCWDPDIVSNFVNAEIPAQQELSGYLHKDTTKFSDLSRTDPAGEMIERGIEFNMQRNLLGACTNYKERLCYNKNSVSNRSAITLSTLVGNLVDQSKQGIRFTEESWERLRRDFGMPPPFQLREPAYRGEGWPENEPASHVVDYLKFNVARPTIDQELTELHNLGEPAAAAKAGIDHDGGSHESATFYDEDLLAPMKWFEEIAKSSQSSQNILNRLKTAIQGVKGVWDGANDRKEYTYTARVTKAYEAWCAIQPESFREDRTKIDAKAVAILTEGYGGDPELTPFGRLKASVAFHLWHKPAPHFLWLMAGRQLANIKTMVRAGGGGPGAAGSDVPSVRTADMFAGAPAVLVDASMYAVLRPDSKLIRQIVAMRAGEGSQYLDDLEEERNHEDWEKEEDEDLGWVELAAD